MGPWFYFFPSVLHNAIKGPSAIRSMADVVRALGGYFVHFFLNIRYNLFEYFEIVLVQTQITQNTGRG
jgi:hypothetical protein